MSNSMLLRRCETCGGELIFNEGSGFWQCRFCGNKFYPIEEKAEALVFALNRAAEFRRRSDFDGAIVEYTTILKTYPNDDEANWGMFIARCGIEYVKDDRTGNMIPTCHRTLKGNVLEDEYYQKAIKNASEQQSEIYQKQAKAIERLQKRIKQQMDDEEEYEVFISFKSKDENGYPTRDSVVARNIHDKLEMAGIKTFFSEVTLADRIGDEFEPIIYKALHSCKYFILVTTCEAHTNAVWVKNEWARFRDRMHDENLSKCAFAVFEGKDCVPSFLRGMQGFDLAKYPSGGYEIAVADFLAIKLCKVKKDDEAEKLKAQLEEQRRFYAEQQKKQEEDLLRRIEELSSRSSNQTASAFAGSAKDSIAPLLKRAFMFLEDGEWQSADEYCEKVLDIDPENAMAYVVKLMAELHVRKQDALRDQEKTFDARNNYQKALHFADDKLKIILIGYIDHINTRNENVRLEGIYSNAKSKMTSAKTEGEYKQAASQFEKAGDYRDSAILARECYEKAEVTRKDGILSDAKSKMSGTVISNYESAIKLFESISDWKDSDEQIYNCKKKIEELKAKAEADRLEQERRAEIARVEAEKRAKRNKKIAIITTSIVCAVIAFIIVLNTVIIPSWKYNSAVALMNEGKIVEAYEALIALDGYKDSAEKARSIYKEYIVEKLKIAEIGDYVFFGAYEQDNNTSNGKEAIEWLVLDKKDGKVLVISKNALDCQQYNTSYTNVTWETCSLRKWLNNDFISSAFTYAEKSLISTVTVSADENPEYSTNPGNATRDKVFLLSITEANKYFSSDSARQCKATAYAEAQGAFGSSNGNCWWWLRSPGYSQDRAARVLNGGGVGEGGNRVDSSDSAVRPALWIDLNS